MRCHQELKASSEVVFVDTSHVDQLNTAVTPQLCAGPGSSCLRRFSVSGFFGKGYPDCFITDNSDPERRTLKKVWPELELYLCIFHILQQASELR
ncbi:hypothetical protein Pmani_018946 [Petrolisthes manimaculis]|uniref:MULE transposase domain-containing protein n=1 Tax=Petrolisthes manimaculis TaxID=1843537 RepID=A0AAE1PLI1_9EUCA|nr:hypothetical protein Pmani_018946 [Petrolisthes manimaculis]